MVAHSPWRADWLDLYDLALVFDNSHIPSQGCGHVNVNLSMQSVPFDVNFTNYVVFGIAPLIARTVSATEISDRAIVRIMTGNTIKMEIHSGP